MERFVERTIIHAGSDARSARPRPIKEAMMPHLSFPNESAEYRAARNALLPEISDSHYFSNLRGERE
jgi:hypothetical protein